MHCRITNCAVLNYTPLDVMMNNNRISLQGTYHEVDHCYFTGKTNQNYFGYRTLPTDNGGEDMRIGDSFTSFTHGFNIIEYNYFEDHREEAEVISNKSWYNIYRFNTFMSNDVALVIRHGQQCLVFGNYFNGKSNRKKSGGVRVVNANNAVVNNYIKNLEGASIGFITVKTPVIIMWCLEKDMKNYFPICWK